MSDKLLKVFKAFALAKAVNHYYWMHTDGDDTVNGVVSVENIERIITLMSGVAIEKCIVNVDSDFHRAFVERYDGGRSARIFVIASESLAWRRLATVKECCHVLLDAQTDFQVDPCVTIKSLKDGTVLFDDGSVPEKDSEHLAEIIAMELIYPLEHRREDRTKTERGVSLDVIAEARLVPAKYVSLGTSDAWYKTCMTIWEGLAPVDPPNLNHLA